MDTPLGNGIINHWQASKQQLTVRRNSFGKQHDRTQHSLIGLRNQMREIFALASWYFI
jgi:hypothetical protein